MWQILIITVCLAQVCVKNALAECEAGIAELKQRIAINEARLEERIAVLEEQRLESDAKLQGHVANEKALQKRIVMLEAGFQERITSLQPGLHEATAGVESDAVVISPYIYSAYGCFQDIISLSCPDARTIFVTSAIYGQFLQTCSHEGIACCPPNPIDDCEEDVEKNNQQDLQAIKDACDNQTSCEFVNGGGYVPSCADPNHVDYMTVNYQCLPESDTLGAIAFTASASTTRDYGGGETIIFNEVVSNFGGGYDPVSSMFTCPVSGVYVISLTVTTSKSSLAVAAQILKETTIFTSAVGENYADAYTSASTTSVLSCEAGERIWVRSQWDNSQMWGSSSCCRRSSVSGFLLSVF